MLLPPAKSKLIYFTLQALKVAQPPNSRSSGLVHVRRNSFGQRISSDMSPSISVLSSFLLPTIPPELQMPLSFLGGDRLQIQISDIDATDLDMRSYVLEWESADHKLTLGH